MTTTDRLAIDRASVRRSSLDGYLHVEISPISKANVCPYYGREIPNSEALGLQPDQVYQLLRDPIELAKAAPTFNHIPLLNQHIASSAAELPKEAIVGSTGTEATFSPPYLTNSLVIWDASSIAGIETSEQRELSSSYHYVADMTPGEFEGVPYDGRMTNIVGNHVALVIAGRAGSDVLVGDSLPPELHPMKPSKKVAVRAALGAYLRPLLAQDGAIPQLNVIAHGNKQVEQIAKDAKAFFPTVDETALVKLLRLARDEADMDDDNAQDESEEDKAEREKKEAEAAKDRKGRDKAKDSEESEKEKADKEKARDEEEEEERKKEKAEDRKATDAAIADARTSALADFRAIRQAERDVQPLVGEVVAMDSAEAVYRFALDAAGVDNQGIHVSALPALVKMATDAKSRPAPRVAMDAAASADFRTRFPTATAVRSA
jgi:hypothetical protein